MVTRTSRRGLLQSASLLVLGSAAPGLALLSGCSTGAGAPPPEAALMAMTAPEALALIRSGRLSAEVYVGAMLDRAERLRDLNALLVIDRAGALAQARRVDAMRAGGATLPVLAGLPIGLELDGPLGSDRRLIAIGLAFESVLGTLPAPPGI